MLAEQLLYIDNIQDTIKIWKMLVYRYTVVKKNAFELSNL